MSFIATAKTRAVKGNMKEAFKNEEGAIDLASIMVGIIVIGLVGGVIAATVFAVIPWAQDNAAKQQLDSISSAQSAYIGLSTDTTAGGSKQRFGGGNADATTFITSKTVGADGNVAESLFSGGTAKVSVGYWGEGETAHYGAAAKSASGKTFYISDAKTQPTDETKTPAAGVQLIKVVNTAKGL